MCNATRLCLTTLLDAELPEYQNKGLLMALRNKRVLLSFDTGLGKTFTYAYFVRALLNRNPSKKHIFVIINDQLEQTPSDLSDLVGVNVTAHSGEINSLRELVRQWDTSSIILLTYEAFRNTSLVLWLYEHIDSIESIAIDEAHRVANWTTSDTAFTLYCLVSKIEYCVGLTATPITSEKQQFYRLMNLIDRGVSFRRDETWLNSYDGCYMSVNRSDIGMKGNYDSKIVWVRPHFHQACDIKGDVFRVTKGTGAKNQVEKLVELLKCRQGRKVIVYVFHHDSREWIENHLDKEGIAYVSLHGRVKHRDRGEILDRFKEGNIDVLLTSISESLNIDADCCIFYEFTAKFKQIMGRAHRALKGKNLEIIFLLTRETQEVEFFREYVYKRSITIQRLLGKDYSDIIKLGSHIEEG